jgi:CheY-like chemotaxis protein
MAQDLLQDLMDCAPSRPHAEHFMTQESRPRKRIRVLVVEDEALSRHALCQLLHRSGFFSAGASDGAQALEMVKIFKPQAIIMDLRMPVLDGVETTLQLKSDPSTAAIPVLALTGSSNPEDRRRAFDAGVDAFLMKPINVDQLMLYLRQHHSDSDSAAGPPSGTAESNS